MNELVKHQTATKKILLCFLHIWISCLISARVITVGKMSKPRLQLGLWDVIWQCISQSFHSLPSGLLQAVSMVPFLSDFHTPILGFQYQTRTAPECQPSDGTTGPEGPDRPPCADCQSFYHQRCPKCSMFSCCSSYSDIYVLYIYHWTPVAHLRNIMTIQSSAVLCCDIIFLLFLYVRDKSFLVGSSSLLRSHQQMTSRDKKRSHVGECIYLLLGGWLPFHV